MYAVIFKAKTKTPDAHYSQTVKVMRELAFSQYNCQDFIAVTVRRRRDRHFLLGKRSRYPELAPRQPACPGPTVWPREMV
ncbi:hypothetical protein MAQ5080_01104 [Marinomonas aquimarina]|uniref:Uncharacterized protein n=2 Tax=Marinomonas aquimarina TaxID=295068 RepID=A0A1A8T944_9GAMM|nr:hypothetical protein MAQ5080_01104 [Marinomonas aquimarina]